MYHNNYDRFNLRTKLDVDLSKRVKLSFNLNPSYIKRERPSVNYIDFVRFYSFLPVYHTDATAAFANQSPLWGNLKAGDFAQARHFNGRIYSGTMPDGTPYNTVTAVDPFPTANNTPKSIMETRSITGNDYRLMSSGDLSINILNGLDFKTMASVYLTYSNTLDFAKRNSNKDGDLNKAQYANRLFTDLLWENTLNYNKRVGDHSFSVLAGFTAQKTKQRDEGEAGQDFPSDNFTTMKQCGPIACGHIRCKRKTYRVVHTPCEMVRACSLILAALPMITRVSISCRQAFAAMAAPSLRPAINGAASLLFRWVG